jgi:hypothetical protein
MSKKIAFIVFLLSIYFASSYGNSLFALMTESEKDQPVVELTKTYTPHLWTDFKVLAIDAELCSLKGKDILESLSFTSIRRNLKYDKAKYVYGKFTNNQASITCAKLDGQTFVYTSVAGADAKIVERLRNEIMWKL